MSCLLNLTTWISNFKQETKSNQHERPLAWLIVPTAAAEVVVLWFCSLIKLRHGGLLFSPSVLPPSALGGLAPLVESICLCDGHLFSWG